MNNPRRSAWYTKLRIKAAFLVGMAASIGAGISMGFAEAVSDDGVLSGRGHPWTCGLPKKVLCYTGQDAFI